LQWETVGVGEQAPAPTGADCRASSSGG
jgi:hypothetical protein